ncbi:protein of unknown function [Candidatus Nitrospira inopinata]|uniref:Uncharacterized protein n=1 Tax=Candidatus Nitrospira inopinata TaxID=1715989 RepID=A0A0S4KQA9_9BACT|nr:protein of unknown function [Candidatus Nitrospira inopinata]
MHEERLSRNAFVSARGRRIRQDENMEGLRFSTLHPDA